MNQSETIKLTTELQRHHLKWCPGCAHIKLRYEFANQKKAGDGKQTYCRECHAKIKQESKARSSRTQDDLITWAEQTKQCSHCGETRPHSEFNKNRSRTDGLHDTCKTCRKQERLEQKLAKQQAKQDVAPPKDLGAILNQAIMAALKEFVAQ